MSFSEIQPSFQKALERIGIKTLTDVQTKCLPVMLSRQDVVVQSPTGSGKTFAFLIPTVELLLKRRKRWDKSQIGCLIIVPLRELASQVCAMLKQLLACDEDGLVTWHAVTGGKALKKDVEHINTKGANILVGTPGRLHALLGTADFALAKSLRHLEVLVLDEADKLIEMNRSNKDLDLTTIISLLPKQRLTALFSASAPDDSFVKTAGLKSPTWIKLGDGGNSDNQVATPSSLKNYYKLMEPECKFAQLCKFLTKHSDKKILVFFCSSYCVDYFGRFLAKKFTNIRMIHGKKSKKSRDKAIQHFCGPNGRLLVATDLMARGMDVPDIDWIVHFNLPRSAELFLHRCGRTARAGKSGASILFLLPSEEHYVDFVTANQGVQMAEATPDVGADVTEEEVQEIIKEMRDLGASERECLLAGTKAFVSSIQAYEKHDANVVCRLKDLDVGKLANGFGLLRMPRMREFRGLNLANFTRSNVMTSEIQFIDKRRENSRLEKQAVKISEKQEADIEKAREKLKRKRPAKRKSKVIGHQFDSADLKDLDDDYKLLKKSKNKKISKQEFEEQFFGDMD